MSFLERPRWPRPSAAVLIGLGLGFSENAMAQEPKSGDPSPTATTLLLSAPPDCIEFAELASRVQARTPRVILQEPRGAEPKLSVQVQTTATEVHLELRGQEGEGPTIRRSLVVKDCQEARDALALVLALTLDPQLGATTPGQTETLEPFVAPLPPRPARPPTTAPTVRPAPSTEPSSHRGSLGVQLGCLFGPAPEPLLGAGMVFGLRGACRGLFCPMLTLDGSVMTRHGYNTQGGTADFDRLAGTVGGCAFGIGPGSWQLRHCAGVSAGVLSAAGRNTEAPSRSLRAQASVDTWLALEAELSGRLSFDLVPRIGRALSRDSYQFEPRIFHRTPSVLYGVSSGVSYRFW